MKKIYLLATALAALVSCTSDDFTGEKEGPTGNSGAPLSFNLNVPSITRADKTGAGAAGDLSNQFIVYGEKNETGENVGTAAGTTGRDGHLVFKNYVVDWVDNSAYTTTSNTKGWEYVGLKLNDATATPPTTTYSTHINPNSGTDAQTIKYWDFGASSYTFTAVSAKPEDITAGDVTITKTETGSTVYDKGYSVVLTGNAHLDNLFFSERRPISSSANTDRTQPNIYGGNVTFRFHNVASKVRVGMYETVPGYTVTINNFTVANDKENPTFEQMDDDVTANFAANLQNCASGTAGTLTVKYVSSGTTINHPTVTFGGDKAKILNLGTGLKENVTIGETATGATYDKAGKTYTSVFPNEANTQNLKLKVSYTLTDPVTHETIAITGKTAEVPAKYLQWKPGYAYTYLFKITDDNLYPITFDALEVIAEDGTAEYITTVTEPSITTYAKGSAVNTNNEYAAGEKVYATVMDGSSLATLTASNMKLYEVTTENATDFKITEASVAEALAEYPTLNAAEQTAAKIKCTASSLNYGKTVVAEDGTTLTMHESNNVVADFTTATGKVYAIEYIKTPATYGNDGGKTYADATAFAAAGTLYSDSGCTTVAGSWTNGTTYYKKTHVTAVGTYAYKIIRVAGATGEVTP